MLLTKRIGGSKLRSMDAERVLAEATKLLGSKIPVGMAFKRPECLACICGLEQKQPPHTSEAETIREFLEVVSRNPERFMEPRLGSSAPADPGSHSSTPESAQSDETMPCDRSPRNVLRSSAPNSAQGDQHMPIRDAHHVGSGLRSSSPSAPGMDHEMPGYDPLFVRTPRPMAHTTAEQVLEEATALLAPTGIVLKRSECLNRIRRLQQTSAGSLTGIVVIEGERNADSIILRKFVEAVSMNPELYTESILHCSAFQKIDLGAYPSLTIRKPNRGPFAKCFGRVLRWLGLKS